MSGTSMAAVCVYVCSAVGDRLRQLNASLIYTTVSTPTHSHNTTACFCALQPHVAGAAALYLQVTCLFQELCL